MRRRVLVVASALAAGLGGCRVFPPQTTVPMALLRLPAPCRADTLVVLLPGAYSRPDEFVEEGFVAALRTRNIAADAWIADAHLGYFEQRSIFERLRADVLEPARAHGYRSVWVVGISLGGFGALGLGALHGGDIAGLVVLAPWLGTRTLQQEITAAGGPRAWRASNAAPGAAAGAGTADMERRVWAWIAQPTLPLPVWLGYGREDRFAASNTVLASLLPRDRVVTVPGGHDWPPWLALWERFLDTGALSGAACRAA